jgi:hypothetical protein
MGLRSRHVVPGYLRDDTNAQFKFCFVRRPYSWYRSYFCYRLKTGHIDKQFPLDKLLGGTFEEWLELILHTYPDGFLTKMLQHYTPGMDFVGKYENLVEDLIHALYQSETFFLVDQIRETPPVNQAAALPEYDEIQASEELISRIEAADRKVVDKFYA